MRQDQFARLQALEEQLLDVFLQEADPTQWPGHGMAPATMDQQTRGDRYWCKKNPAATLMLAMRVQALVGQTQNRAADQGGVMPTQEASDQSMVNEQQLDSEIASAEKEAARLMRELQRGTGKAAFDRKVHGRG